MISTLPDSKITSFSTSSNQFSNLNSLKKRTDKVRIEKIINLKYIKDRKYKKKVIHCSWFNPKIKTLYKMNKIIFISDFDPDIKNPCSSGIHYFDILDIKYLLLYFKEFSFDEEEVVTLIKEWTHLIMIKYITDNNFVESELKIVLGSIENLSKKLL